MIVELDMNSIEVVAQDTLTKFHSGIKSEETRKPMTSNLATFLNLVCKKILKGNLSEREYGLVEMPRQYLDGLFKKIHYVSSMIAHYVKF